MTSDNKNRLIRFKLTENSSTPLHLSDTGIHNDLYSSDLSRDCFG